MSSCKIRKDDIIFIIQKILEDRLLISTCRNPYKLMINITAGYKYFISPSLPPSWPAEPDCISGS